jgi:hypothetical protein
MTEAAAAVAAPPPASSAIANPPPASSLTPEAAAARLDAIKADPAWREAFAKGDIKATGEHAELFRVIYSDADGPTKEAAQARVERESLVNYYRSVAHISDDVAKMVVEDSPVSADERQRAELEWQRLKGDPEWVRKWLAGDRQARTQKTLIDIIMARPIKQ